MRTFSDSLKKGQLGEEEFYNAHKRHLDRLDGLEADFQVKKSGLFVELKSDSYDMEQTPNFFFERYSDATKKTPGGPWQALAKGAEFFVYFFPKNGSYFVFRTKDLVTILDRTLGKTKLLNVVNTRWVTQGFKVARQLFTEVYEEFHIARRKKWTGLDISSQSVPTRLVSSKKRSGNLRRCSTHWSRKSRSRSLVSKSTTLPSTKKPRLSSSCT